MQTRISLFSPGLLTGDDDLVATYITDQIGTSAEEIRKKEIDWLPIFSPCYVYSIEDCSVPPHHTQDE
jgi:hypothetical protein